MTRNQNTPQEKRDYNKKNTLSNKRFHNYFFNLQVLTFVHVMAQFQDHKFLPHHYNPHFDSF